MTTREKLEEIAEAHDLEFVFLEGFDDCIQGVIERQDWPPIICYNRIKIIQKLINGGMVDEGEAEEYFEYNILGSWMGDATPCFLTPDEEATI